MMNPVQAQQSLGQLSDGQLQQVMQSGSVPQFLVLAEIARRRKTRTAMTAATPPAPTVAEDAAEGGVSGPPQPFACGGSVQRFASGGTPDDERRRRAEAQNAIAFANLQNDAAFGEPQVGPASWEDALRTGFKGNMRGTDIPWTLGEALDAPKRTPRAPAKTEVPPAGPTPEQLAAEKAAGEKAQMDGIAAMNPRMNASGVKLSRPTYAPDEPAFQFQDRSGAARDKVAADRGALSKRKKSDWAETLMRAGAAMMAAKSDNFLANAAEGLNAGVEHYSGSAKERRKDADTLSERELAIQKDRDNQEYLNSNLRLQATGRKNDRAVSDNAITNQEKLTNAQMQQDAARYNLQADARRAQMAYMAKLKMGTATQAEYKALYDSISKSAGERLKAVIGVGPKFDEERQGIIAETRRLLAGLAQPNVDPLSFEPLQ